MSEKDALFVRYLEEVDVGNVTMFCEAKGDDGRVVSAEIYGRTVPLQILPGKCKATVVHVEVMTMIGSEDCVRRELMDTVTGAAERWAKECLGNGMRDDKKEELRICRQSEVESGEYWCRHLRCAVRIERRYER
jgi:hypothetical protein